MASGLVRANKMMVITFETLTTAKLKKNTLAGAVMEVAILIFLRIAG